MFVFPYFRAFENIFHKGGENRKKKGKRTRKMRKGMKKGRKKKQQKSGKWKILQDKVKGWEREWEEK